MTRKISTILRVFNTYIFLITEKKTIQSATPPFSIIKSIFGEHCIGLANIEYQVDRIVRSMQLKLRDILETE